MGENKSKKKYMASVTVNGKSLIEVIGACNYQFLGLSAFNNAAATMREAVKTLTEFVSFRRNDRVVVNVLCFDGHTTSVVSTKILPERTY